jgi:predicted membrane protein
MAYVSNEVFTEYRKLCEVRWGVKIAEKSESKLMKAIAAVLFFNKSFLTGYITTIGTTVYWPKADGIDGRDFKTLFHEAQHAYDYRKSPLWFVLSYLSPQVLAIFSLMSLLALTGNLLWLLSMLWLAVLAPIPSVMRTYWEMRGYSCGIAEQVWLKGAFSDFHKEYYKQSFMTAAYYFMWPFSRSMDRKLSRAEQRIRADKLTEVQKTTKEFLFEQGMIGNS